MNDDFSKRLKLFARPIEKPKLARDSIKRNDRSRTKHTFVRSVRAVGGTILKLFEANADVRMIAARHLSLGVARGR